MNKQRKELIKLNNINELFKNNTTKIAGKYMTRQHLFTCLKTLDKTLTKSSFNQYLEDNIKLTSPTVAKKGFKKTSKIKNLIEVCFNETYDYAKPASKVNSISGYVYDVQFSSKGSLKIYLMSEAGEPLTDEPLISAVNSPSFSSLLKLGTSLLGQHLDIRYYIGDVNSIYEVFARELNKETTERILKYYAKAYDWTTTVPSVAQVIPESVNSYSNTLATSTHKSRVLEVLRDKPTKNYHQQPKKTA